MVQLHDLHEVKYIHNKPFHAYKSTTDKIIVGKCERCLTIETYECKRNESK